jgi:hypothetical protein
MWRTPIRCGHVRVAAADRGAQELDEALRWLGYTLMSNLCGADGEEFLPGVSPEALGFVSFKRASTHREAQEVAQPKREIGDNTGSAGVYTGGNHGVAQRTPLSGKRA